MAKQNLKKIEKINRIFKDDGLQLEATITANGDLKIGGVTFYKKSQVHLKQNEGLILKHASEELRQTLQQRGISYIDEDANLFLNTKHGKIILNPDQPVYGYRPSRLNLKNVSVLNPTNLISPIGLSLIDTLFRMQDSEIEKFESVLKFCKLFNLPQPKISLTMGRMKAKSLIELKNRIKEIPLEWWLFGFESPMTRRKMVNFFEVAKPYHSLIEDKTLFTSIEESFQDIAPGPTEVAKKLNLILDNEISLWTSNEVYLKLLKQYRLVPGAKEGYTTWMIAPVPTEVLRSFVVTQHKETENYFKTNLMRTIWDLSYGESRLREIREDILRIFIYNEDRSIKIF